MNKAVLFTEANLLMNHYLTLRNQVFEDSRPYGNLRVEQSHELLKLLASFGDSLETLSWSENYFSDINSMENQYLRSILEILKLESIDELDNGIIGDFKLKCDQIEFPINSDTELSIHSINNKEIVEGEILKAKIVMSYSMNFLSR